jgi:hypothetical protein
MTVDLYSLCQQLEASPIGDGIKNSTWLFPAIEAVHLIALALLGGALLMLDLRLIGVGLTGQATSAVERSTRPWLIGAILTMIATGVLIGFSEALKLLDRKAFTVKMIALAAALLFTFAIRGPQARRDIAGLPAMAIGVVSLGLWLTVALAGRWIGFS